MQKIKERRGRKRKGRFENIFYTAFVIFLLFCSLLFFILGVKLNEQFFIKFSGDKRLEQSTIERIKALQSIFLIGSSICLLFIFGLFYFKNHMKLFIKKHKSLIQNFLLLFGTVIFFFVILEVTLRIIIANETSGETHGTGPGTLKFNAKYVKLNDEGFRDRKYNITKPENTVRIIGLGDSLTFASGIKNANNSYLKILESKLNAEVNDERKKYEVLNFGLPGRNSEEEVEILKENGLKYNPDIIIVGYFLNDFEDIENVSRNKSEFIKLPFGFWLRNFLYSSYFLETRINKLLENVGYKVSYEESLIERFSSEINKEYNKKPFAELEETAEKYDMKVMILIFPMIYKFEDYPFKEAHEFVNEVGKENNFYVLDILSFWNKYKEENLMVNKYDRHPNEFAHNLAGEAVFEKLIESKLI